MKFILSFLSILIVSISFVSADNYAVLIAGSRTWSNYRHQADIFHAYQIMTRGSADVKSTPNQPFIKPENIIVFAYDDIANSDRNPWPGKVINRPNGPDVYEGVKIDYSGEACNADNLLAVLRGQEGATEGGNGRVLKTGPTDRIFINYSDHGAPGYVAMPSGNPLYAKDLHEALVDMKSNNMYAEIVLYIEACESGSMFSETLSNDMNIYATTAANPTQPSYAWYYIDELRTYAGDEYSITWMEQQDVVHNARYTIGEEFAVTKEKTTKSEVCEYGDLKKKLQPVGDYFGYGEKVVETSNSDSDSHKNGSRFSTVLPRSSFFAPESPSGLPTFVSSRDVDLDLALRDLHLAEAANDEEIYAKALAEVDAQLAHRQEMDDLFTTIVQKSLASDFDGSIQDKVISYHITDQPLDLACIKEFDMTHRQHCGHLSDYALKWAYVFGNLCAVGVEHSHFESVIIETCV